MNENNNIADSADSGYALGKYHNQNIKRDLEKVEKASFELRRKLFLRLFTDTFLSFDIYYKYQDHFEILLVHPINEKNLNTTINSFCTSVKNIALSYQMLSAEELVKDCEALIRAEAYHYMIKVLQDSKTTLKKVKGLIRKFKSTSNNETKFGIFSSIIIELALDVINWKKSTEYILNDVSDEDDKLLIIKNTLNNFEQLDSAVLSQELLANFEITNEEFNDVFLGEEIGDMLVGISKKAEENYTDLYQILKYDFIVENFQAFKRKDKDDILILYRNEFTDINKRSLYYFSQGAIDGLTILVLIQIFFRREKDSKHNKNREMIIRYMEKYRYQADEEFINFFEYIILHHKYKNIIFLVYISRALCLTRREAFKLSMALGFGNEATFKAHYDSIFYGIFKNYIYIK